jgi:hypothetical protein
LVSQGSARVALLGGASEPLAPATAPAIPSPGSPHAPIPAPGTGSPGGVGGAIFFILVSALALTGARSGRRLRLASVPLRPAPLILGIDRPG